MTLFQPIWLHHFSLRFNSHFPGEPVLASSTGAKGDGYGGDNLNYTACEASFKSSSPTNQHPMFYRLDDLTLAQPTDDITSVPLRHNVDSSCTLTFLYLIFCPSVLVFD